MPISTYRRVKSYKDWFSWNICLFTNLEPSLHPLLLVPLPQVQAEVDEHLDHEVRLVYVLEIGSVYKFPNLNLINNHIILNKSNEGKQKNNKASKLV